MIAYCWRSGEIEFGQRCPRGAITILQGKADLVRGTVEPAARRAYDGKTLLVPGIPEADDDAAAEQALTRFNEWVRRCADTRLAGAA